MRKPRPSDNRLPSVLAIVVLISLAQVNAAADNPVLTLDYEGRGGASGAPEPWVLERPPGTLLHRSTRRRVETQDRNVDGRLEIRLQAIDTSFSLNYEVNIDPHETPWLRWRWRADELPRGGELCKGLNNQAVQLVIGFDDCRAINYLWDSEGTPGSNRQASRVFNPRDLCWAREHLLTLRSGPTDSTTLVPEERNIMDDYRALFGLPDVPHVRLVRLQSNSQHGDGPPRTSGGWFDVVQFASEASVENETEIQLTPCPP